MPAVPGRLLQKSRNSRKFILLAHPSHNIQIQKNRQAKAAFIPSVNAVAIKRRNNPHISCSKLILFPFTAHTKDVYKRQAPVSAAVIITLFSVIDILLV